MDEIFKYKKSNDDYYQTLGCDENSSTEQIACEYKTRAVLLHPDKQHNKDDNKNKESEELFKQLVKAKQVLTDPQLRKEYDKWRASGIAMSFDKWNRMGKEVHISMHWVNRQNKDLMLESGGDECQSSSQTIQANGSEYEWKGMNRFWRNDYENEMLRKFRNYQI